MPHHSKRSIEQYYAEYPEHDRLRSPRGQLEFERTKRIVKRFLPSPPAIVADVGGGTGPYSFWLGSLGYETHLIEQLDSPRGILQRPNAKADCTGSELMRHLPPLS